MAAIDIGNLATDRSTSFTFLTIVDKANPANASGAITSIEIWAVSEISDCEVATFFIVADNNLSTRDTVTLGTVTSGSKQTFTEDSGSDPISLTVQEGDYIGVYATAGTIECSNSGEIGFWYQTGDQIPCTDTEFVYIASYGISLHGTGETEAVAKKKNVIFMGSNF